MTSPGLYSRVEAIPGIPLPTGILTNATTIVDVGGDSHELMGVDWLPQSCCDAYCWEDSCPPGENPGSPGPLQDKHFCRPQWHSAAPVTVYSGVECSTIGFGYDEAVTQATTALQLGQQRALEQWTWTNVLAPRAVDRTPPSGPVGVAQAVGLLEGWLAAEYGGLGVLHVPAAAGALLASNSLVRHEGARLRSNPIGHNIVVGAGYQVNTGPDGQPAPEGTVWLAISGPVTVRREAVHVVPGSDRESVRIQTNDRMVLAERTFVVQVSCAVVMVLACLGCGCD